MAWRKKFFSRRAVKVYGSRVLSWVKLHPVRAAITLVAGGAFAFTLLLLLVAWRDVPDDQMLRAYRNPVPSEVYTADSVLIGRFYLQNRTPVSFDQISPSTIYALIATEDVRFYRHNGVDVQSLGRVLFKTILLDDESSGGGSTITQQLSKNIFPRKRYKLFSLMINKVREALIALRLERIYTKNEILNLYLNTVPFGDNTYGIEAAARRFFSVPALALTTDQSAVLIGMLKATHSYNPRLFPEESRSRRNVVLSQMEKYGYVLRADSLKSLPVNLKLSRAKSDSSLAPYFRDYVRLQASRWCEENERPGGGPYNLYTDGLTIYTTVDSRLQRYAEEAVRSHLPELQRQFFEHWESRNPWEGDASVIHDRVRRTSRYRKMEAEGRTPDVIMKAMHQPVATTLFTWDGVVDTTISPIDSVKHHIQLLHAGFIAMNPTNGEVKAWVGGIDYNFFQYDHVREGSQRQVGSIFKPVVFAAAIEQGISPCEWIPAAQETYIDDEGELWRPRNSRYDYPVSYSMRGALAYSVNTVSVKLIQRAGIRNTIDLSRRMGITSAIPEVPSIALGSSAISLVEMASAYAVFANDGIAHYPTVIKSIKDRDGNLYHNFRRKGSGDRVLSKKTARLVRHMLQTVVREGTASRLRYRYGVYNDAAGKTGTTQDNADGWFMAITPQLVIGVWVGADDPRIHFRDTRLGEGANTALPVAAEFLKAVNGDHRYTEISSARFDDLSADLRGMLACDLYELSDELQTSIEASIVSRDSVLRADTLTPPPPETFLQKLYYRKQRMHGMAIAESDGAPAMN